MPSLSSYTPFESLLFFQFLNTLDSQPSNFAPISELLTNNSFVRENETFNKDRLTPQALQALYTDLVHEELQNREGKGLGHGPNGYSSDSNPKKRKIQDPSSKQLLDGVSHSTVIPALVARLYAIYKERVTREIEEDERKYTEIKDDIRKLENGEYPRHATPIIDGAPAAPQIPEKAPQTKPTPVPQETVPTSVKAQEERDGKEQVAVSRPPSQLRAAQAPTHPKPALAEGQGVAQQGPPPQSKNANTPAPTTTWLPPQVPPIQQAQQAASQNIPPRSLAPSPANGNAPILPAQAQIAARGSQYTTSGQTQTGVKAPSAPQIGTGGAQGQALTATSGASQPAAPSLHPMPASTSAQQQSQRPTATFQPVQYSPPQPQTPQATPGPNIQQPWPQQQGPQTPYAHVSPFANVPYSNSQLTGKSPLPLGQSTQPSAGKPFQSPYGPPGEVPRPLNLGPLQKPPDDVGNRTISHPTTPAAAAGTINLDNRTPSFSASLDRRAPRPSLDTTGSLTPWKRPSPIVIAKSPGSPIRPRPEDVSPISERAPSPTFEIETAPSKTRSTDVESGPSANTRTRKTTPALGGTGAGSPVSSPARATRNRSRARSNVSRDDESIADSASVTKRQIKHEIPSTPAGISDETEMELRASNRLKAPTQAQADESLSRGRGKRKRGPSETYKLEDASLPPTRQAPYYVHCTRNFPRTTGPIMNDVASHKYASIFAKPLTELQAPGYRDLIYRPQDIKSIKSAIHHGSKAITAATEAVNAPSGAGDNVDSPGPGIDTPPSKSNGLLLKRTAELIPPKGIVNSAQLEMELVRMFANAVMFNPTSDQTFGPSFPMQTDSTAGSREGTQDVDVEEGGIINDTLEMYDDVEKAVSRWRAAERAVDDLGGKSMLSLRRGSASDINMDSADEVK
ncbi:hypothetical protein AJ79_04027 [Helicocarpus griseus UAMH5409]|uniref:Uncharacterized protein n=1 Tax=Helicocarpus griseus UAMH5409 TaxID=1447875 RepID=A0A2B7XVI6_9EURO|nr:hypothetical protein AJ79_04027 [Helicocarpus griseus UAMH5409]